MPLPMLFEFSMAKSLSVFSVFSVLSVVETRTGIRTSPLLRTSYRRLQNGTLAARASLREERCTLGEWKNCVPATLLRYAEN